MSELSGVEHKYELSINAQPANEEYIVSKLNEVGVEDITVQTYNPFKGSEAAKYIKVKAIVTKEQRDRAMEALDIV